MASPKTDGLYRCTGCGERKPIDEFRYKGGNLPCMPPRYYYSKKCKVCEAQRDAKREARRKASAALIEERRARRKAYKDGYNEMTHAQYHEISVELRELHHEEAVIKRMNTIMEARTWALAQGNTMPDFEADNEVNREAKRRLKAKEERARRLDELIDAAKKAGVSYGVYVGRLRRQEAAVAATGANSAGGGAV